MHQPPYPSGPGAPQFPGQSPGPYGFSPQHQPPYGQPPPSGPASPQPGNPSHPGWGPQLNPGYPQPGGQGYPQQPQQPVASPPKPRKSKAPTVIIIVMGVIIAALAVVAAYVVFFKKDTPSPGPSDSATPTPVQTPSRTSDSRGWTISGNQLTGPTMTAQLPAGWGLGAENGKENDGDITDGKSRIKYVSQVSRTGEDSCKKNVLTYRQTSEDLVEQLSGQTWGGKPADAYQLTTKTSSSTIYIVYCLNKDDGLALLKTGAWAENSEQLRNAVQVLLTTWQWK